jgi:hypothetical protein
MLADCLAGTRKVQDFGQIEIRRLPEIRQPVKSTGIRRRISDAP